jgi:DNA-binding transcriptional LysR family regulator
MPGIGRHGYCAPEASAPEYLARNGTPQRPEDLLRHECITFRSRTTGALYAWELERGRRTWRVPVRGGIVFLYFPSRSRRSAPLRLFVEAAREAAGRRISR